jgi:hypothetical protein
MNKRGHAAKIAIFGIPVAALIYFGFQMWATGLVIDAISPELENALRQLDDNVICPPELSNSDYTICIGKNGEIIVNGLIKRDLTLQLDSPQDICSIKSSTYNFEQLCTLENIWKAEKLFLAGVGLFKTTKTIQMSKIISYTKSGKYLRALKLLKYLPK